MRLWTPAQWAGRFLPPPRADGLSQEYHINQNNLNLACNLVDILQPFYKFTLQVSIHGGACISDIFLFIDQITNHLSTCLYDKRTQYPVVLRSACSFGIQLTNKYYTLTNCSPLYQVAMGELFFSVFHFNFTTDKAFFL
jgi:hypothetical protein